MAKEKKTSKTKISTGTKNKTTPKKKVPIPKKEIIRLPELSLDDDMFCSFCGSSSRNTMAMLSSPPLDNICICDICIEICSMILLDLNEKNWRPRLQGVLDREAEKNI
jgi:hypothetical protein